MKKHIITATAFAACLALCASVRPQSEPVEEIPVAQTQTAATAAKPEVPEMPEIEEIITPEEEKLEVMEPKQTDDAIPTPEPTPTPTPTPTREAMEASEQESESQKEPEPTPTSPDSAPDNMVYVPGFGWIESQGPNHCEYAEDMYENGNKIGIMG